MSISIRSSLPVVTLKKRKKQYSKQFTEADDKLLTKLIASSTSLTRAEFAEKLQDNSIRQVWDRWMNYLNPNVSYSEWTVEEDLLFVERRNTLNKDWQNITPFFPKRTVIVLKNRWNIHLRHLVFKNKQNHYQLKKKTRTFHMKKKQSRRSTTIKRHKESS